MAPTRTIRRFGTGTVAIGLLLALALTGAAAASAAPDDAAAPAPGDSAAGPSVDVGGVSATVAARQTGNPTVNQTHEVRLAPLQPDTVYVDTTLVFENPGSFEEYVVDVSGDDAYRVADTDDFTREGDEWVLDDGVATAEFTVALHTPNATFSGSTSDSALVHFPLYQWDRFESAGSDRLRPDRTTTFVPVGEGVVREDRVLLGDYGRYTNTRSGTTVELIVSADAELEPAPETVLDSLSEADEYLEGKRQDVSVLAIPPYLGVPGHAGDSRMVVAAGQRTDSPDSTWLHEYVHVTEDVEKAEDFAWFTEGYAEYEAAHLALEQGRTDWRGFRSHLSFDEDEATVARLSDPDTWGADVEGSDVYGQGAIALGRIDFRIRQSTDGQRTLQDVVARLHGTGEVSTADFLGHVEAVSDESVAEDAKQYVTTESVPSTWTPLEHERAFEYDPTAAPPETRFEPVDPESDVPGWLNVTASDTEVGDAAVEYYEWDWGDGATETTERPDAEHFYEEPGQYEIELTVVDENGRTDTDTHLVGTRDGNGSEAGTLEWAFTEPSREVAASPTIVNGTVYVDSTDGTLYAVDAETGEREWAFTDLLNSLRMAPTVADGTVYVGDTQRRLSAVDAETGESVWAFADSVGRFYMSPSVVDGTVYVPSEYGTIYAFDAATGAIQWNTTDPSIETYTQPTVVNGTLYVGAYDQNGDAMIYALDANTGHREWTYDGLAHRYPKAPTVADGTVFVGGGSNSLYAVDADTGRQEWTFDGSTDSHGALPTVFDGTVYAGFRDGTVYAVDADTGEEVWNVTRPKKFRSPTVAGGRVYAVARDGTLYAMNATNGREHWRFTAPAEIKSSVPTVVDGTLYLGGTYHGDDDGALYAVRTGHDASSEDSRVRQGTLGHVGERPSDDRASVTVTGAVRSGDDDAPVADATVRLGQLEVTTDEGGEFSIELPAGEHELVVEADDFDEWRRTVTVEADGTPTGHLDVELTDGGVATVGDTRVRDVNGDGNFRDVTGDSEVGQGDVAEFFGKQHRDAWKRPELFDFTGNGAVTHGDVVALADYVALQ